MTIEQLISSDTYPKKVILEKLVCHKLELTKEQLFLDVEKEISSEDLTWIDNSYIAYTLDKKPLEYILWYVTFTGIQFAVTPDTLIPRPETEYMIEAVNEYINQWSWWYAILDIGTWCGVLWLAVLYHNNKHITKILLSELGPETLAVARSNSKKLFGKDQETSAKISFVEADLLNTSDIHNVLLSSESTVLVANLPYIPEELFENNTDLGIKKREPKMAFVAGEDGLDLYRIMFDQLIALWAKPVMFLEMMTWQCDILRKEYPLFEFEEVKTFHFNIRILKVMIN